MPLTDNYKQVSELLSQIGTELNKVNLCLTQLQKASSDVSGDSELLQAKLKSINALSTRAKSILDTQIADYSIIVAFVHNNYDFIKNLEEA